MTQIPDAAVQAMQETAVTKLSLMLTDEDALTLATAALPHLPLGYEVKKLEWVSKGHRHPPAENLYAAETSFGLYMIAERQDGSRCAAYTVPNTGFHHKATNLDEAKVAAQSDFERRLRDVVNLNPIKLTDGEINDITYGKLGKWPSFEAQSWACKVVHTVLSQIATKPVDVAAVNFNEIFSDLLSHVSAWKNGLCIAMLHAETKLPDIDDKSYWRHEINALDNIEVAIRALSAEPVQGSYSVTDELRDLRLSILQSKTLADFCAVKKTVEAITAPSSEAEA